MPLPYSITGNVTGSINSGSYLNSQDNSLFYVTQSQDIWYGFSPNDVIEFSSFTTNDNTAVTWEVLNQDKQYTTITSTYIDNLNNIQNYSYAQLNQQFILYKNSGILVNPIDDLVQSGISDGNYNISYNFIRNLAGNSKNLLSIKEISPSRTELKLIPQASTDIYYTAFCQKLFAVRDVSSVLLTIIQSLPYDSIYASMAVSNAKNIDILKSLFFLGDENAVISFLKMLYEDYIKYTLLSTTQISEGNEPTRISRVQGIRSYFNNFLLQNLNSISDFDFLESQFSDFVTYRIDQQFERFKNEDGILYEGAKKFCHDFFVVYFYGAYVHPLQSSYQEKYFGPLKNALNFGNNEHYKILNSNYIDERTSPTDALTLLIKLADPLPINFEVKANCWVSNFSMAPYTVTTILQNPVKYKTIKISGADFGSPSQFITTENVNKLYSSDDLASTPTTDDNIYVNKSIAEINTDYSDFSNFIVFSSAATRTNIFKNKIITWTNLSASLDELNRRYLDTLVTSSLVYPYYSQENESIQSQMTSLIQSFDGYESYLFGGGHYIYSIASASFEDSEYITDIDLSASLYDRNNRDSLFSNTPEYIQLDQNNEEYLTFLAMAGHHFDNIYTYISALPIERQIRNELKSSVPNNTLKEMLISFGWDVDDIIDSLNIDEVYLNSLNGQEYDSLSANTRLQTIWNRILVTLPGIYKTKGTEECVKYLMSCYGLPTSLISIREYGGTDFSDNPQTTYELDEKTYMLRFSGIGDYIEGPIPSFARTIEFKFAIENPDSYAEYQYVPLFTSIPYPYTSSANNAWSVGFSRIPGQETGQVSVRFGSGSRGTVITSSTLPIFNGDIFSVLVRRNYSNSEFEYSVNDNIIPIDYDLTVQRNESGRKIFYSTSSINLEVTDSMVFSQYGRFRLGGGSFVGTLDKLSIWNIPVDDGDFEEHVNDINSYGYSGSAAYRDLWVRLFWDYPQNMYTTASTDAVWVDNQSPYYAIPNYYSTASDTSSPLNPTLYSASVSVVDNVWLSYYPTGSVEILAYNFPVAIDPNFTTSFSTSSCSWISSSVYPYHFRELTYQQNIDATKYGPNKFKNKKIRKVEYDVEARFDSDNRSTSLPGLSVSGESNQLGFFIDPQDSKNKDILRYLGRNGIMELIGDPSNIYSDKYYGLINKNVEYNSTGNKKTLFNELLTVYKFYFDKSIFQAIKNIVPARSNIFTGVVIEPTILERPKYQNREITSSLTTTQNSVATIDNIYTFSEDCLWANFSLDWMNYASSSANSLDLTTLPPSYNHTFDLTYINDPVRIYPDNFFGGYVTDLMDDIQQSTYADYEKLIHGWDRYFTDGVTDTRVRGSVSRQLPTDLCVIGPHHETAEPQYDESINRNDHQILYYMIKVWEKYDIFKKTGNYVRSDNPAANTYASASTYLYKYVIIDERYMRTLAYIYDGTLSTTDPSTDYFAPNYIHYGSTFRGTPNQIVSNVVATNINPFNPAEFDLVMVNSPVYFEISHGYPRNHYIHKVQLFTNDKHPTYVSPTVNVIYIKGRQTIKTTINERGIDDGTYPVQSFNTSNVNVMNTSNVIASVPSANAGVTAPPSSPISQTLTTAQISPIPVVQTPVVKVKLVTIGAGGMGGSSTNMYSINDRGQIIKLIRTRLTPLQVTAFNIGNIVTIDGVRYQARI